MTFKKFQSIPPLHSNIRKILKSKNVVITEKLNGSNFRVLITEGGTKISFGTRNRILVEERELSSRSTFCGGVPIIHFYKTINLPKLITFWPEVNFIIIFGEWYKEDFFVFQVWFDDRLLSQGEMIRFCLDFNLYTVPFFGVFNTKDLLLNNLSELIKIKQSVEEGIIIQPNPAIMENGAPIMAKFKNDKWTERKIAILAEKAGLGALDKFAMEFVTSGRLNNIISHGDFVPSKTMQDMRALSKYIWRDIQKEFPKEFASAEATFGQKNLINAINSRAAKVYMEMLK